MMSNIMSEQELQAIETKIPSLAKQAFRNAYAKALKVRGHVLVVKDGHLGESSADGSFKIVRPLKAPVHVVMGTIRTRTKRPHHE
jgi:hypothetical protein